jgi:hypothetical protein
METSSILFAASFHLEIETENSHSTTFECTTARITKVVMSMTKTIKHNMHIFAVSLEMETSSILFAASFHLEIETENSHSTRFECTTARITKVVMSMPKTIKHFRKRPTKIRLQIDKHY